MKFDHELHQKDFTTKKKENPVDQNTTGFSRSFCGAGGNRTRVQTRKQYAFYMFIPRLGFRIKAGSGPPTFTLAS